MYISSRVAKPSDTHSPGVYGLEEEEETSFLAEYFYFIFIIHHTSPLLWVMHYLLTTSDDQVACSCDAHGIQFRAVQPPSSLPFFFFFSLPTHTQTYARTLYRVYFLSSPLHFPCFAPLLMSESLFFSLCSILFFSLHTGAGPLLPARLILIHLPPTRFGSCSYDVLSDWYFNRRITRVRVGEASNNYLSDRLALVRAK